MPLTPELSMRLAELSRTTIHSKATLERVGEIVSARLLPTIVEIAERGNIDLEVAAVALTRAIPSRLEAFITGDHLDRIETDGDVEV